MHAYVFPGQGAQYPGMGKELYENNKYARELFDKADEVLGFSITDVMFNGSAEDLKRTAVTQPAVFLHSVILAKCLINSETAGIPEELLGLAGVQPDMVAGHSLGEFSALVVAGALSFEEGLRLVSARAQAMQEACEQRPGTMAAVIALDDATIERICAEVTAEADGKVVIAANYNCPGQVVVSGDSEAVALACEKFKEAGAKRALPLAVGGAFHSPLMESARAKLAQAIEATEFAVPQCPICQNFTAQLSSDSAVIKANLLSQLTGPVRWTESVRNMAAASEGLRFTELGPGTVLKGLIAKILK